MNTTLEEELLVAHVGGSVKEPHLQDWFAAEQARLVKKGARGLPCGVCQTRPSPPLGQQSPGTDPLRTTGRGDLFKVAHPDSEPQFGSGYVANCPRSH